MSKEILFRKFDSKTIGKMPARQLSPDEQAIMKQANAQKNLNITMTPPKRCPGCGVKTKNLKEHGYGDGLLMFPIPNMGICHFTCPKCFTVFMNKECFETQRKLRKAAEAQVQVPKHTGVPSPSRAPLQVIK